MDDKAKQEYEARAKKVRADLKQWEADWAKAHGGEKPGREDIKNAPSIAQKYKDYNKLRDIIAGKAIPTSADSAKSKSKSKSKPKPKSDGALVETPLKRSKYASTPSKTPVHANSEGFMMMNSPAVSRKLFSPAPLTSLGPTPQRDGKVLGLFDLLVEREAGTPSKRAGEGGKTGGNRAVNAQATPSKRRSSLDDDDDDEILARLGRTPMSASKRQRLNTFMTPLKNKDGQAMAGTPTSVSKLQFDTPAFLKRHSLPTVLESAKFDAPAPLRLPRKPLVRGLSEIVASLRKVEEDTLDEDLEALREAENDDFSLGTPIPKPTPTTITPREDILEPDSQARQLPLGGFDDEGMYDSPTEEGVDRDGKPLRVFKKKGQKRTTRRVNMRPVRVQRPTNAAEDANGNPNDEDGGDVVPDIQAAAAAAAAGAGDGDSDIAGESDADFEDKDDDAQSKRAEGKKKKEKKKEEKKKAATKEGVTKEGVIKKAARKVNELAHANFQRLKLRNHGAKGGPGFNSRFRRKR